jgi:hypothetical protein
MPILHRPGRESVVSGPQAHDLLNYCNVKENRQSAVQYIVELSYCLYENRNNFIEQL